MNEQEGAYGGDHIVFAHSFSSVKTASARSMGPLVQVVTADGSENQHKPIRI